MFVSKRQAFGQRPEGITDASSRNSTTPAWQRQLCSAQLARLPGFEHPLALNCSLTSRKVGVLSMGGARRLQVLSIAAACCLPAGPPPSALMDPSA